LGRRSFAWAEVNASNPNIADSSVMPLMAQLFAGRGAFKVGAPPQSVLFRRGFLQLREDFIQIEAGRLLPLRVILERHQELTDEILRRNA
jgi:hypothetical protein